jgi:hypothetical protein
MKNFFKFLGIIALVAVIGFSMAACEDDSDDSGNTGGSGSKDFSGTWGGDNQYGDNVPVTVVITGDDIKITANSKDFTGKLEAVTEGTFGGLTQYERAITGKAGCGVSKWEDENKITLSFFEYSAPYTFDIEDGLFVTNMTKK